MLGPKVFGVLLCLCTFACGDSDSSAEGSASSAGADAAAAESGAGGRAAAGGGTSTAGSRAADGGAAGSKPSTGAGAAGMKAAGSGGASPGTLGSAGTSSPEDAGVEPPDAAVSCEGEIVSGPDRCLQDDAFCYPLADGRYCTGPSAPECPRNSTPIAKDAPCPERTECFELSESLRCARRLYTLGECADAGGVALADPGDGSLVCPTDATALGSIEGAGWDEGGLCCPAAATKQCGARAGDTCTADEYCAYQPSGLCGQADAQATCKPRPSSCSGTGAAVCGCDQRTYPSACEANKAGTGIFADGACQ